MASRVDMSVLVAEPSDLFRMGIVDLLLAWGYPAPLEASTGQGALDVARAQQPDVAVVAMDLQGPEAPEVVRIVSVEVPDTSCLLLSLKGDDYGIVEGLLCGAFGFFSRGLCTEELSLALCCCESGLPYGTPGLARALKRAAEDNREIASGWTEEEQRTLRDLAQLARPQTAEVALQMGRQLAPVLRKVHA